MAKTRTIKTETAKEETVKKSISFSRTVFGWADEMANKKGYGSNFSAYISDLIRRDRDRERELGLAENLSAEVLEAALAKKKKN